MILTLMVIDDISMPDEVTDPTPLLCNTNRPPPTEMPANSGGDWISPTDIRVGIIIISVDVPGFGRNKDAM